MQETELTDFDEGESELSAVEDLTVVACSEAILATVELRFQTTRTLAQQVAHEPLVSSHQF